MTKEEVDKILKALMGNRDDYVKECKRQRDIEGGKIMGAEYMTQRFLDILKTEIESSESESEECLF